MLCVKIRWRIFGEREREEKATSFTAPYSIRSCVSFFVVTRFREWIKCSTFFSFIYFPFLLYSLTMVGNMKYGLLNSLNMGNGLSSYEAFKDINFGEFSRPIYQMIHFPRLCSCFAIMQQSTWRSEDQPEITQMSWPIFLSFILIHQKYYQVWVSHLRTKLQLLSYTGIVVTSFTYQFTFTYIR